MKFPKILVDKPFFLLNDLRCSYVLLCVLNIDKKKSHKLLVFFSVIFNHLTVTKKRGGGMSLGTTSVSLYLVY